MSTNSKNAFPQYPSHEEVVCFACGSQTDHSTTRSTSHRQGQYVQRCPCCGKFTHYDVD